MKKKRVGGEEVSNITAASADDMLMSILVQVTAVSSQSANSSCSVEDSVEVHLKTLSFSYQCHIVQVLSVIRYNKLKMSAPPSTLHSISGSDTASIMSQVSALLLTIVHHHFHLFLTRKRQFPIILIWPDH